MTQGEHSTVDKAIFAAWFDCNWDYLDSLLDARQRALQSRASGAVGRNNLQAKPRRQRKPSIKKMIAAAERAGKSVTSITTPDGTTLHFGKVEDTEASNPWLVGIEDKVTKQ